MKFIGLSLIYLFSLVCADEVLKETSDLNETQPLAISLKYESEVYSLNYAFKLNWFQANAYCARSGYTLAAIPSEADQTAVFKFIRKSGFHRYLPDPIWTSGTNQANSSQWSWFATGKPFSYRKFLDPAETTQYGCLGFNIYTGYWSVEDCAEERYILCQKPCP